MKIGVITDCFKKSHTEGIELAAKLGLDGVQIYATTGEFSPALGEEEKAKYKALLAEKGLIVCRGIILVIKQGIQGKTQKCSGLRKALTERKKLTNGK